VKEYGLIVIGSGAGMNLVNLPLQRGEKVAVVEEGPLGGTCLNRGCIPSKMLIHAADAIREAEAASRVGVRLKFEGVDFPLIKKRMWDIVLSGRHEMEHGVKATPNLDLYNLVGSFVSDYTMKVGDETIRSSKIVIASGARASVPRIPGLESMKYHTYRTVFDIEEQPESVIILGGGYIGCEFAHFFSAIGTRVTLVGRNPSLLPREEPETSALVKKRLSEHVDVRTGTDSIRIEGSPGDISLVVRDQKSGKEEVVRGEQLLVATGVRSNSDWLRPEATGVKTDEKGWILTNQFLETSRPGIYALGDALGRNMYRHTANYQSMIVGYNLYNEEKMPMDLHAVPHAVFTDPQVAQVGMTADEAVKQAKVMVGVARYLDTAMGFAYADEEAFVKVIVEHPSRRILGATAVGPQSALLIQQVVNLMVSQGQTYLPLARAQIIHPTLSEVLASALGKLKPANFKLEQHHHV